MKAAPKLKIWETHLPNVEHGILPPGIPRPNPLVAGSRVFVSVFSPGAIVSLNRRTGKIQWRRELPPFGADSAYFASGILFVRSTHTLFALAPQSGRELWRFCPYGTDHEWIYSHPTVWNGRLFIGDRRGFLHCLNARTGETIWRAKTNREGANANATPLVIGGLVIVSTNAQSALAYDAVSGKRVWKRSLDGPATFGLLKLGRNVVVIANSVYLLPARNGVVTSRVEWPGKWITSVDSCARNYTAVLADRDGKGQCTLAICNARGVQVGAVNHRVWCPTLRFAPDTGLGYLSHLRGVRVLDQSGNTLSDISVSECGVGLVEVRGNMIYLATAEGRVIALKHPRR